jgi:hypothetical protein
MPTSTNSMTRCNAVRNMYSKLPIWSQNRLQNTSTNSKGVARLS